MAQFSYVTPSIETLRELRDESRVMETVFLELCSHADPYGMAYPGIRRLADKSHYSEDSVQNALVKLGDADLFRCHLSGDGVRARPSLTYQMSPYRAMYIREQLFDEVVNLWHQAKSYAVIRSLTEYVQPETTRGKPNVLPESQPEAQPHTAIENGVIHRLNNHNRQNGHSKPDSEISTNHKTNNGKAVTQTDLIGQFETHAIGETHGEAIDKKQIPPPPAPPPPFTLPLEQVDAELLAQDLRVIGGGTKLERAREIVWRYGVPLVKKAMAESGGKRNRIGFIVSALKGGWVKCDPLEDDPRRYLIDHTGQFLDPKYETPENIAWRDSVIGAFTNG